MKYCFLTDYFFKAALISIFGAVFTTTLVLFVGDVGVVAVDANGVDDGYVQSIIMWTKNIALPEKSLFV